MSWLENGRNRSTASLAEGHSQPQNFQDVAVDNSGDDDSDSDAYVNDCESEYENDADIDYE